LPKAGSHLADKMVRPTGLVAGGAEQIVLQTAVNCRGAPIEMDDVAPRDFATPDIDVSRRGGGELIVRAAQPLRGPPPLVLDRVAHWATVAPTRVAVAECRIGTVVRRITYGELDARSRDAAARLADLPVSGERPVVIVAENSIDNLLIRLAAMRIAVPFAPLSPSLLRNPGGPARFARLVALLTPGLIYADDGAAFAALAQGVDLAGIELATGRGVDRLLDAPAAAPAWHPMREVGPDTVAAIFFTSGSTSEPKGVITTHRMLGANQQAYAQLWPFLEREPPVLLDWLPWHHTFGGNDNLNKILWHGGTLYVDDGRPTADRIDRTIANIKASRPSLHINVPRGLDLLLRRLGDDAEACAAFVENLRLVFFAAAGLDEVTWSALRAVVTAHQRDTGRRVALVSGWGSTEGGSTICLVHFPTDRPGNVGLPLPGYRLKLVPADGKLEARITGPNVTPGYWRRDDLTCAAFDQQGFFRTGDALRFLHPEHPEAGLMFDGRLSEDFKLATGTWVSVGPLRLAILTATAPLLSDAVVGGENRDMLGLLALIDVEACRRGCGLPDDMPPDAVAAAPAVRERIRSGILHHNMSRPASSTAVRRVVLCAEPPSLAAGEVNEKGYVNQRTTLARRAAMVDRLHADPPPEDVLCF
jgi:feruloyl-CoA synthase